MATEDFTTYTEVDSLGRLTVTSSKIEYSGVTSADTFSVYKSYSANHFTNFQHIFTVHSGSYSDSLTGLMIWAVSDDYHTEDAMNDNNNGIRCTIYKYQGQNNLYFKDETNELYDESLGIFADNTTYYCTVSRSGTTGTLTVYSDAGRTNVLDTLSITTSTTNYEYINAICSLATSGTSTCSGYVEDLDLQETIPTVTTQAATSVATTSCTGNGNITNTGGANATRRGFCYMTGTSGDPTTANSVAYEDGDFSTGAYTKSISGLTVDTGYRLRAYAVNTNGTGYGTTVQVTTYDAGGDNTTIGDLTLLSTINCISVISYFSGDANEDNSATLYYKVTGAGSWLTGIDLVVDRRANLTLFGSGTISNPYDNTYRTFIYNLLPNTSYDVKVTYADTDGGGGDSTDTISTKRSEPASSGTTYYVSKSGFDAWSGTAENPWLTVAYAATQVSAGDIVKIGAGTYSERVTLTTSGTVNNNIIFESEDYNNPAIITNDEQIGTFYINGADYNRIRYLDIRTTVYNGQAFRVQGDCIGNIIEHNDINIGTGSDWWCGAIWLNGEGYSNGPTYTIIRNNNITNNVVGTNGPFGVIMYYCAVGMTTIKDNTISGGFYDTIACSPNFETGTVGQYYVYGNTLVGASDDTIEAEGGGMNTGIWDNICYNIKTMGLASAPCIIGPLYVFRNVVYGTGIGQASVKLGSSSDGHQFYYHNTFNNTGNSGFATYGSDAELENITFRNNILDISTGSGYIVEDGYGGLGLMDFDYNCFYSPVTNCVKWQYVVKSYADWRTNDSQEPNGVWENVAFVNEAGGDFHLTTGAAPIDAGVALQGFNDADSPYPKVGGTPDMGAYEFQTGGTPPTIIGAEITKVCGVTPDWIIGIDV